MYIIIFLFFIKNLLPEAGFSAITHKQVMEFLSAVLPAY